MQLVSRHINQLELLERLSRAWDAPLNRLVLHQQSLSKDRICCPVRIAGVKICPVWFGLVCCTLNHLVHVITHSLAIKHSVVAYRSI